MRLEEERNHVGIHNCERCGTHQSATGREPSLRSARIKATNSSAPSGSHSVSVFKSSMVTGGLRITPAGGRIRSPPASILSARCGISISSLAQRALAALIDLAESLRSPHETASGRLLRQRSAIEEVVAGMPKSMPTPCIAALFRLARRSGKVIENARS